MTFNIQNIQTGPAFNINNLKSEALTVAYEGGQYVVTVDFEDHTYDHYGDAKAFIDAYVA